MRGCIDLCNSQLVVQVGAADAPDTGMREHAVVDGRLHSHYILRCAGIRADEIDILVVTSSVFCPTPSVASMLVNQFKMREDVQVCSRLSVTAALQQQAHH